MTKAVQRYFLYAVLERQRRIDFRYVTSVKANWEVVGYRLAANRSHSIGSVHRLVLADTDTSIFGNIGGIFRYLYQHQNNSKIVPNETAVKQQCNARKILSVAYT